MATTETQGSTPSPSQPSSTPNPPLADSAREAIARLQAALLERAGLGRCEYTPLTPCLLVAGVLSGEQPACRECAPHLGKVQVAAGSPLLVEGMLSPLPPPPSMPEGEYPRGAAELLRAGVRMERVAAGYALVRQEVLLGREELNRAREVLTAEVRGQVFHLAAHLSVRGTEALARYEAFQCWSSQLEEWAAALPAAAKPPLPVPSPCKVCGQPLGTAAEYALGKHFACREGGAAQAHAVEGGAA